MTGTLIGIAIVILFIVLAATINNDQINNEE